jgi:hypothetical protein
MANQSVIYDLTTGDNIEDIYRIDVVQLQNTDVLFYVWLGTSGATDDDLTDVAAKSVVWVCLGSGSAGGAKQTLWVPQNFAVAGSGNAFPTYIGVTVPTGETFQAAGSGGGIFQIALNCYRSSGVSRIGVDLLT